MCGDGVDGGDSWKDGGNDVRVLMMIVVDIMNVNTLWTMCQHVPRRLYILPPKHLTQLASLTHDTVVQALGGNIVHLRSNRKRQ